MTEEIKEKIRNSAYHKNLKGKNNPMYGIHRFGKNSPMFGKHHSIQTKRLISKKAKIRHKGKGNPNWKGGKRKNNGYIYIYSPNHPFRNKNNNCVFEHRLIVENYLNRYLKSFEYVHHINKNKTDNRIENFIVFNNDGAHRIFDKGFNVNKKYIIFDGRNL